MYYYIDIIYTPTNEPSITPTIVAFQVPTSKTTFTPTSIPTVSPTITALNDNQLGYRSSETLYNDLITSISTACSGADSELVSILREKDVTGVYQYTTVPDEYPIIDSYVTVFVHSPAPTSTTSLSPTCGVGSYGDESGCQRCPPGTYGSSVGLDSCTKCSMNYYTSDFGCSECTECEWPFTTYEIGSDSCSAVYLDIHGALLLSPIVMVAFIFVFGLWSVSSHRLAISLVLLFPTIDIVTDMLYLLHTRFYNVYLFGACIVFLLLSSSTFIFILFQEKLYPRMYGFDWISWCWWIGVSNGYPTVNGDIKVTSFSSHDSLPKVIYLLLCWVTFVLAQCICGIPVFILIGLHSPFYVFWLMIGALLFQMKMVAVGPVLNFWIYIWSDNQVAKTKLEENHIINATYFNISSVNSLVLETVPQLLIQCINSSLVSNWSTIGAVSIAMSGMYVRIE